MGIASTLAGYVHGASYADLPQEVISATKDRVLDFLETAFFSYWRQSMLPVLQIFKEYDAKEEATVIGYGMKLPCALAAMANSSFSNISDGYRFAGAHPSSVIVPAAIAAAEARSHSKKTSGQEFILAIVLGYEVMLRLGQAMYPAATKRGFCPTAIDGTVGVAATVGRIFALDKEAMLNALSIASLMGPPLEAATVASPSLLSFHFAVTTQAGVLSAQAARNGMKGTDDLIERVLLPAFGGGGNNEAVTKNLGTDYRITRTYLKPHGGCRLIHAAIDAMLHLVKENNLKPEDIEAVKVKHSFNLPVKEITATYQTEFSLEFAMAAAILFRDVSIDRYTEGNLRDQRIQNLMKRTTTEYDIELDKDYPFKRPAVVEIKTKGGRALSHRVDLAKGEPETPLSRAEIEDRFKKTTARVLSDDAQRRILEFVTNLETARDVTALVPLLKVAKTS